MASGGTIDHKVMSVYKGGTLQRMPFTEGLKNSSAATAWNDHEERFTKHLEAIRAVNEEFQRLQGKEWTTFSKTTDLGKLYYEYILAKEAFDKEFSFGLPMLKEKYVAERTKVKTDLEQEIKEMINNWAQNHPLVHGLHKVLVALKSRNDYSKYCRLSDQWWKHKSEFEKQKKAIDDLIKESARSTRVSSAVPKLHEIKSALDLVSDSQRSLIKPESVATTLAQREKQLKEIELILQKSTVEWIAYVENPDLQEQKDEEAEADQPKAEKLSKTHDESALKDSTVVAARAPDDKKRNPLEKLDRGLELLQDANNSTLFDDLSNSRGNSNSNVVGDAPHSANIGDRQHAEILLPRDEPRTESAKSHTIHRSDKRSNASRLSEKQRLTIQATILEAESCLELEEKEREIAMKKKMREQELAEMQEQNELESLKKKQMLRKTKLQARIDIADAQSTASSIKSTDSESAPLTWKNEREDHFSKWLDQQVIDRTSEISSKISQLGIDKTRPTSVKEENAFFQVRGSRSGRRVGPPEKTLDSQMQRERSLSQSKTNKRETKSNNFQNKKDAINPKLEYTQPSNYQLQPLPHPTVTVTPETQWLQPVSSLPKLKLKEFTGDPLEWPEWSSLFNAVIHNAPVDDNTKMSHPKTLVKDKAKAAIAGFGYSGALYHTAWQTLERNFGRPQSLVNAQMRQIYQFPFIKSHDSTAIIKYSQLISTCVSVLIQYGFTGDLCPESVLSAAVRKLPPELKTKWLFHAKGRCYLTANLSKFSEWLNEVAYVHDELLVQYRSNTDKKGASQGEKARSSGTVLTTTFTNKEKQGQVKSSKSDSKTCPLNDGEHKIWGCDKFKKQSPTDRYETVKKLKLCFCCLNTHLIKDCKSERKCGFNGCIKKHNRLLHVEPIENKESANTAIENKASSSAVLATGSSGVLQLVPITVRNSNLEVRTTALLDTGSTVSFIDEKLKSQLKLSGESTTMTIAGIHGMSEMSTEKVTAEIAPFLLDKKGHEITFCTHPKLNVGDREYNFHKLKIQYEHLTDLPDEIMAMKEVKIILGQDVYPLIRPLEYKTGGRNEPWAVKTELGWTLSGPLPKSETNHLVVSCNLANDTDNEILTSQIKRWWDMETYASLCNVSGRSKQDERAFDILKRSTRHNGESYEVGLLWADDSPDLPNNYSSALQQFYSLEKRLDKDVDLKDAYQKTIQKDLENGFIRVIDKHELQHTGNNLQWYLPHHPVKHPHKPGKVRRVCNAASKFKGTSLNDKLLTGPDLLRNLIGIIFRFREHEVAINADIESMFLQVGVPVEDCRVLRFLWRNSDKETLHVYEYNRHVFGSKDSPTCANYALQQAGKDFKDEFPKASEMIERNFYMDDLVKSVSNIQEAQEHYRQIVSVMSKSGFALKKWASNKHEVLEAIPEEDCAVSDIVSLDSELETSSILGLEWIISKDILRACRGSDRQMPEHVTQRTILSFVSSVFDPLGLLAPFTMRMRILLKSIWIQYGQRWDESVSNEERACFLAWATELTSMRECGNDTSSKREAIEGN